MAHAEIATFRNLVLHVAARTTRGARQVRLRIDIGLGDPPAPVPQPFAALLLDYAAHRSNMRTATNPGSTWLFPGRRAGQPRQLNTRPHQSGTLSRA